MKTIYSFILSILIFGLSSCDKPLQEYTEPDGSISGYVIDAKTGKPLKDIFIVFEKVQNGAMHGTISKEDGAFNFNALSTGDYKVYGMQDTMKMVGDTSVIQVKNGHHVDMTDQMKMLYEGVPEILSTEVIQLASDSLMLRVNIDTHGCLITDYHVYYTYSNRNPTVHDQYQYAGHKTGKIGRDFYETKIKHLRPNTTYHFMPVLGVKNHTGEEGQHGSPVVLGKPIEVKTLPKQS